MGKVIEGFKTSTNAAREISKCQFQDASQFGKDMHAEATAPHPGMKEVKNAKGFGGKCKAIGKSMKDDCAYVRKQNRQFREDAVNLKGTKDTLEMVSMIQESIMGSIPCYTRPKNKKKER